MKKLTIQIDHANDLEDGLKNYLQSLNGTSQITINKFDNKIDITGYGIEWEEDDE